MGKTYTVTYITNLQKLWVGEKPYMGPLGLKKICNLSLKVFHSHFRGNVKKKKIRGKKLMGSGKWSHVNYVIIKICVIS